MSSDDRDVMISVRGLSKAYTISHDKNRPTTLAESVGRRLRAPFGRGNRQAEAFWALKDVSFDVKRGDVVGVIGRNGAGKSTLFKVLSRITEPTAGRVDLYGRVGSLLEVGTGFSGELTGRENIYLNGSILGMRRAEIAKRFDEIVDFAGVEQFLDTPVKRYSSGMYVRLAFAVAAHLQTDILVLDEVLAVGDATFQTKCLGKIGQVARDGRTILLVSHNIGVMRSTCTTAIELRAGQVVNRGTVEKVSRQYEATDRPPQTGSWINPNSDRTVANGNDEATIVSVDLLDCQGRPSSRVKSDEHCRLRFRILVGTESDLLKFGFDLVRNDVIVFRSCQVDSPSPVGALSVGIHDVNCSIPPNLLFAGAYSVRPHMSVHCVRWLIKPDTFELGFEVDLQTQDSPFLNLLNPGNHPGSLFPRLQWSNGG